MNAHNFKNLKWHIIAQFACSNGEEWFDTRGGIAVLDTIGESPNKILREFKDCIEKRYYSEVNHIYPEMEAKIISCKVEYIPFADARKRAEQLFEAGMLEKEAAEHFGLN